MNILPLFVVLPLVCAFILSLVKNEVVGDILSNLISLIVLIFSFVILTYENIVYKIGGWEPVNGIPIGIYWVKDGLTSLMLIIVNFVSLMSLIFSINYINKFTDKNRFYCLFMLMLAGLNGVILSGDIFNMYVFLEITSISSYSLVAFGTEKEELEASFKYQVMGIIGSSFILLGIALLYSHTGTLNMADCGYVIKTYYEPKIINFITVLFIVGFLIKAGIMPFHAWLPDAYSQAPGSISSMLSGATSKILGIYCLTRIMFNVVGVTELFLKILIVLGVISIMIASILALFQKDFNRLLAYSSIAQMGYVLLGLGLSTIYGILGGLFHFINHGVFKPLLFLNSGSVVYATGSSDMSKLGGLNKRMSITGGTSFIGSMSVIGLPPFNGFWSKLIIILACIYAKRVGLAIWAIIGSIITLAYYVKLQRDVFFGEVKELSINASEVPCCMKLSMIILSILCIFMGLLYLPQIREFFLMPAVNVLLEGTKYCEWILK